MAAPAGLAAGIATALHTTRFGRPLHVHALVTSTNDLARGLADSGAEEGTVVLALEQSRGKGRLGRSWASPPGGLYLTVVLRPTFPHEWWPLIGFAFALGAAAAAEAHARAPVRLKWPNDLLLGAGKVGGILIEAAGGAAVCGIGINVIPPTEHRAVSTLGRSSPTRFEPMSRGWSGGGPQAPSESPQGDLPPGIVKAPEATWLAEWNPGVSVVAVTPDVLLECERWYAKLAVDRDAVLAAWRARTVTLGRRVHVEGVEPVDGIAEEIDPDGALRVRTASGVRRVLTGDVSTGEQTQ